jgi:hypothetical protein
LTATALTLVATALASTTITPTITGAWLPW